jgi:hypothetical protein
LPETISEKVNTIYPRFILISHDNKDGPIISAWEFTMGTKEFPNVSFAAVLKNKHLLMVYTYIH